MNIGNQVHSILIVGARGMLGREVVDALKNEPWKTKIRAGRSDVNPTSDGAAGIPEIFAWDLDEIDITRPDDVQDRLTRCRPQLVVNCAAYTDVDGCETHRQTAFAVNGAGPGNLAGACRAIGGKLVHISTDFVFDGRAETPYKPDDPVGPLSVYGQSKLAGERAVRENLDNHLIIRTSWLFGQYGKNFVRTIRRAAGQGKPLRVVEDQVGSPTYAADLAGAIWHLVDADAVGTYHFCNEGICSWYQFAREILQQSGLTVEVHPVTSGEYPQKAIRPAWSAMDTSGYREKTGQPVRPWQEALGCYLQQEPDLPD